MRNLKKFLALVLAMMMTLSLMVTVNASSFKDDDQINSTYAEAVNVLTELKVIKGYKDGDTVTFDPKANITRAEVAAIVYRIFTGDVGDKNIHLYDGFSEFTDVAADKWYTPYVNFCANNGLVNGVGNNRFAPSANVTGYEALVMILRAVGYNNPAEFSSSDWKFKASGYGSRLGITKNIPAGSLGASATREMVAEIMFQGLLAPTVTYSPLTMYTENLLVDASEVNEAAGKNADGTGKIIYAADVKSTLMYEIFKIVGKRTVLVNDDYGRPVVEWVKDATGDTIENGGKYIPNAQTKPGFGITAAAGNGVAGNYNVEHDAAYVPASTPDATYAKTNGVDWYVRDAKCIDKTALSIAMTPVKTYYDVVTECNLSKDVNGDKSINATYNLTEWLNGAKVSTRGAKNTNGAGGTDDGTDNYIMDALHTATGDNNPTVGAPGRTTEVYIIGRDAAGNNIFVFVYIDTMMGVVNSVTPRTFDTAGHVMTPAVLSIKVNDTVNNVQYEDDESDFEEWKAGDLILLTTYGGHNWSDLDAAYRPTLDATDSGSSAHARIQTSVPTVANDFLFKDATADSWAVDILDEKPTTETFTVNATTGSMNSKTGLISTDNKTYMGNVVYLANEENPLKGVNDANGQDQDNLAPVFYQNDGATDITTQTTVPGSVTDYGVPMVNARIGQSVTAVRDPRGYVVGLTMATVSSDIGVILGMDSVRIATGKYAVEAELLMMDGSKKTVRFLDNQDENYNDSTAYEFFPTQANADLAITDATKIANVSANTLVQIKPFTKEGATYYKVTATDNGTGTATKFPTKDISANPGVTPAILVPDVRDVYDHKVQTGVADTLTGHDNGGADTTWAPSHGVAATLAANIENIDDNTKFIVAEYDYRYNQGEANEGGYTDLVYKTYTGFKNLPTITGADHEVKFQKVGNNVFIHPELDARIVAVNARRFTLRAAPTYPVDETYLVLATIATYADHATYKVLKDGVETTLEVANNNLTTVNNDIETALAAGNLIYVDSKNAAGYATSVVVLDGDADNNGMIDVAYTLSNIGAATRTIAKADVLEFANTGVLYNSSDAHFIGGDLNAAGNDTTATYWLTMADNCKVVIVNLINGTYVEGNLNTIMQYEDYKDPNTGTLVSHDFVYELDANGYISCLYIID